MSMSQSYEEELEVLVERQQELVQSERLFDLEITAYPELNTIQKDMAGMRLIYDIYLSQKVGLRHSLLICARKPYQALLL